MAAELKRLTFVVTPDVEESLSSAKKEIFYARTRSDMIRDLLRAGLRAAKAEKAAEKPRSGQAS